ncbi:MAG TPA: transglycosylase SLT domain-containing protein [Acidobacteriaceae bacterium]|nr:transglycosylase SLT domain-containing protein [Acidobacteriaceae bacterium]
MLRRSLFCLLSWTCLLCLLLSGSTVPAFGSPSPSPAVKKKSTAKKKAASSEHSKSHAKTSRKASSKSHASSRSSSTRSSSRSNHARAASPRSIALTSAFHASEQLRPMAQQLAATRSVAAYAGVTSYAKGHPGEPAAAAYLALAHAYTLDHRYIDALNNFALAKRAGTALDDYADYLGAQAAIQAGRGADAYPLLDRFAERHPDSIFIPTAPLLLANAHLQQQDAHGALAVLEPLGSTPQAGAVDFEFALARSYQLSGQNAQAIALFHRIYTTQPLSSEAVQAFTQLRQMGAPLSSEERKTHADALFNARRYTEAGAEYTAIQKDFPQLGSSQNDALAIYAAVCQFRIRHLSRRTVERLPDTSGDPAAAKQYMLAELSRDEHNSDAHDAIIARMIQQFPGSRWLEEALYSGGNMYLLKRDAQQAIYHYSTLVKLFPTSTYAPSAHWRSAWMNYRTRNYSEAARLMDEQIVRYAGGAEIPGALYWRGRIYEDEEHNFSQAAAYYRKLLEIYPGSYYAMLGRQRLKVLGPQPAVQATAALASMGKPPEPKLVAALPEDDAHLIKARLLANAALNEYIGPEISAADDSDQWGALAQAEIYASFGEYTRALQSMKHSGISFLTLPVSQVPPVYWRLLFPQPYWTELVADSGNNGLDPYLVASLIRQESEFNATVVSRANAYGLMQLLPSVGRALARKDGMRHFQTRQLLDPSVNLQLGTKNLKEVLDRFGGQVEYALAAYNAGDTPVRQWLSSADYKDIPEFVESIPYSETRDYVQAILRNREMYRTLYPER